MRSGDNRLKNMPEMIKLCKERESHCDSLRNPKVPDAAGTLFYAYSFGFCSSFYNTSLFCDPVNRNADFHTCHHSPPLSGV